jgi:phosphatidylglycerol:prolipoprotein diacylglycerol transferase
MRQTLFYIPHELFGLPVFGWQGWAAMLWLVVTVALIAWLVRKQGWTEETYSYFPVLLVLGFAVTFLLPGLEEVRESVLEGAGKETLGLPIRGYGVFLLLAVVAGIGLAVYRARLMGVDPEIILTLAFWMFICGIAGARAVYVYQYWDTQFYVTDPNAPWYETLKRVVDVSKGGLVVFGSLIGGLGAALAYCYVRKQPFLAIADLIAPSLVLGLAIGRIGCLMNGCCYGGLCDRPWAIEFPAGDNGEITSYSSPTPPYAHQLVMGQLHGFRIGEGKGGEVVVRDVRPGSVADKAGLKVGDVIRIVNELKVTGPVRTSEETKISALAAAQEQLKRLYRQRQTYLAAKEAPGFKARPPELILDLADGRKLDLTLRDEQGAPTLPAWSLPIHPTQIYAAINGALLTILLLAFYPYRTYDGTVIALLMTLYPITRYFEETIRDDESKSWFLGIMTISQAISVGLFLVATLLWIYILTRRQPSVLPPEDLKPAAV